MAGRKTKLTPETHGKIVAAIRLGAFDWVAAEAVGVGQSTFYAWLQRGEQGAAPYREFLEDVRAARAEARKEAEWAVRKDKPLEWLRIGPGRDRPGQPGWTESNKHDVTGGDGGPIRVEVVWGSTTASSYGDASR